MSKIGRKAINIQDLNVTVDGQVISYKGAKQTGTYTIPSCLSINVENDVLRLTLAKAGDKDNNNVWGLHRALLANQLQGAREEFSVGVVIVGLGYKGELKGDTIVFSLGYSHKIEFLVPKEVTVSFDKTGQHLTIKSCSKFLAGDVAQRICAFRRPEPYKGTGVRLVNEVIHRKVGKN